MVFVKGYFNLNLGDDLFLKILSERYIKEKFYIVSYKKYYQKYYKNVKFTKMTAFVNRFIKAISLKRKNYENYLMLKSKLIVNIGGSIFMEKYAQVNTYPTNNKKGFYILGSNFGPYKTQEFYEKFYNVFANAEDICFRDEYSYNLFNDLPNTRYASDIVFALDTSNIQITNNKKVIISVIDCDRKVESKFKEDYENKIIEMIKMFDSKNYEVVLMSYCKGEGDEIAIESILSKITNNDLKLRIKKYYYNGNINEALNVMGDCQIVVGSRFHANILGLVLNKAIIPIAYSDKTLNVLNDMNFKGKIFDIRDMNNFNVESITEDDLNYKLDVSFQKEDAQRHFEKLDLILKNKE